MNLKLKDGHRDQFLEACNIFHTVKTGLLGWRGQARLLVDLGIFPVRGNKRQKRKTMKRILIDTLRSNVLQHLYNAEDAQ